MAISYGNQCLSYGTIAIEGTGLLDGCTLILVGMDVSIGVCLIFSVS